jgi:hypothetical protein
MIVAVDGAMVPAGLMALYSAAKLYDGNVVKSEVDRQRIRCGGLDFSVTWWES